MYVRLFKNRKKNPFAIENNLKNKNQEEEGFGLEGRVACQQKVLESIFERYIFIACFLYFLLEYL
jgi:hypothetical protein